MEINLFSFLCLWIVCVAVCAAFLFAGYWMGRNSIGKPFNEFQAKKQQPPKERTAPVIEYNPWEEALLDPKLDRKNTVE